jgi:hypothetical protein
MEGVSVTSRPLSTPGKDPVPIVQEAWWAAGPVWTGVENLAPPGFDFRTVQPVARSLYRLSYPAHILCYCAIFGCSFPLALTLL